MERREAPEAVPYIVFEAELARQERHIKRLWIAVIAAVIALVVTVCSFVWYLNQYDFESFEQDGEGVNIIGDLNGVDYSVAACKTAHQESALNGEG